MREGIDSISLNPDTVIPTRLRIAYTEKTLGRAGKRTSRKHIGLVALVGVMAAGFISLGAGCTDITGYNEVLKGELSQLSAAQLREKFTKYVEEEKNKELASKQEEFDNKMTTLNENTFASFSFQYPGSWAVEHWNGGMSAKSLKTGEYVSVFLQLVSHPVAPENKNPIMVGGRSAYSYEIQSSEEGQLPALIVELKLDDGKILEININSNKSEAILNSFLFSGSDSNLPERALNHWDVRDKKVCVQMITYARQNKDSQCQVFSTPCDVPQYWEVCDEGDI